MQFNLQLIISIVILLGMIFQVYRFFRNPDIEAKERIDLFEQQCKMKHEYLNESLLLIRENHLKHLEADVTKLKLDVAKIIVILEERLPKNNLLKSG